MLILFSPLPLFISIIIISLMGTKEVSLGATFNQKALRIIAYS